MDSINKPSLNNTPPSPVGDHLEASFYIGDALIIGPIGPIEMCEGGFINQSAHKGFCLQISHQPSPDLIEYANEMHTSIRKMLARQQYIH